MAVSAGYAPVSIGTDTRGSLTMPAGRAALYTIKPTAGKLDGAGVVPISPLFDQAGPMAKTSADVADVLDILTDSPPEGGYAPYLNRGLSSISIAALPPRKWQAADSMRKPGAGATEQLVSSHSRVLMLTYAPNRYERLMRPMNISGVRQRRFTLMITCLTRIACFLMA